MHEVDIPVAYHIWGTILESYQRYTPKLTNVAKLKDLLTIRNDLQQEFV